MGENMYCGIGNVPRGKIRGTPEYCVQVNQVRYYGLEKINENLIKNAKGKTSSIVKEQLKLKEIEEKAKALINEVKKINIILAQKHAKPSQIKSAEKKLSSLLEKRDKIVKSLKIQIKIVDNLEKEEAKEKAKNEAKIKKSNGSKSKKTKSKRNMI